MGALLRATGSHGRPPEAPGTHCAVHGEAVNLIGWILTRTQSRDSEPCTAVFTAALFAKGANDASVRWRINSGT